MNNPVKPETLVSAAPEDSKDYTLSILRVVSARLKLIDAEVNSIGVALSRGLITSAQALLRVETIAPGCYDAVALSVFAEEASQ